MIRKQYFGIKYPFTSTDVENYFTDLNPNKKNKVRSQLMHVIFTPKGQRIRMPDFGTDLIKYIFEPNDVDTWKSVKNEISESVSRYIDNVVLDDIQVARDEDDPNTIFVRIDYSIKEGNVITRDSIAVEI